MRRYTIVKSKNNSGPIWRVVDSIDGSIIATFGTKWEAQDYINTL